MSNNKKLLIISPVGNDSLHKEWLDNKWDTYLIYYGDTPDHYKEEATHYRQQKGIKWPTLSKLIEEEKDLISQYEYVWLPDDDVSFSPNGIQKVLDIMDKNQLWLTQPALHPKGYITHGIVRRNIWFKMRYTNFIEVMAPFFSTEALYKCLPSMKESISGWGMDYLWPRALGYPPDKIAIIDAHPMVHTRPLNLPSGKGNYQGLNEHPADEADRLMAKYSITRKKTTYKRVWFWQSL